MNDALVLAFLRRCRPRSLASDLLAGERRRRALNRLEDGQCRDFPRTGGQSVSPAGPRCRSENSRGDESLEVFSEVRLLQAVEFRDRLARNPGALRRLSEKERGVKSPLDPLRQTHAP